LLLLQSMAAKPLDEAVNPVLFEVWFDHGPRSQTLCSLRRHLSCIQNTL
jgi:hypothetical protein